MFCYKCGKKLLDGAMFCAFCGTKVMTQDETEDDTETINNAADDKIEKEASLDTEMTSEVTADDEFNEENIDDEECDTEAELDADEEPSTKSDICVHSNADLYNLYDSAKLWTVCKNANSRDIELIVGGYCFPVAPPLRDVVMMKAAFDRYIINAIRKFADFYNDNDIAGVISSGDKMGCSLLIGAAEIALKYHGEQGLYSVTASDVLQWEGGDDTSYRTHSMSALEIWRDGFYRIQRIFNKINEDADTEKEYRELRKESRTKLQAMGFGLSGYISGSMKAGAYNMATGAGHSIVNAVQNAMTESERTDKLNSLYSDKDTLLVL